MRTTIILTITTCLLITSCNQRPDINTGQSINAVIGDISFVDKFGIRPDNLIDEQTRIKTHLQYVEQLLRQKDISSLSSVLQKKRTTMLDLLHAYWTAGQFPSNYNYPDERKPCFIDRDGNICAVGYLVEQTASRQVAETINSLFQYNYIFDMDLSELSKWISNSGLTLEECAMIQPKYGNQTPTQPTANHIDPVYGISSTVLSVLNVSLSTINATKIGKSLTSKTLPLLGLISGAGQITLGAIKFPRDNIDPWTGYNYTNESQKALSLINIGIGTTTMIMSTYNLLSNRQPKDKTTAWNVYSYSTAQNQLGLGFIITKKF